LRGSLGRFHAGEKKRKKAMGEKEDSFADRLWKELDDAFDSVSPERLTEGLPSSLSRGLFDGSWSNIKLLTL